MLLYLLGATTGNYYLVSVKSGSTQVPLVKILELGLCTHFFPRKEKGCPYRAVSLWLEFLAVLIPIALRIHTSRLMYQAVSRFPALSYKNHHVFPHTTQVGKRQHGPKFLCQGVQTQGTKGLLRTGHFCLCSEDVGKRDFPARSRAATNVAATRLAATRLAATDSLQFYRDYYNHTAADQGP